jgi:hypothetical protein
VLDNAAAALPQRLLQGLEQWVVLEFALVNEALVARGDISDEDAGAPDGTFGIEVR